MRKLAAIALCIFLSGGCAAHRPKAVRSADTPTPPATRPLARELLPLDQIGLPSALPNALPATRPSEPPPLKALQLYAQARSALHFDRNILKAVTLLREAADLDPASFSIAYALGAAHANLKSGQESSITWLTKAAALQPDHLDAQLSLGRQYLAKSDSARALERFRLAMLTSGYRENPESAALVDLALARALQQQGYETAAIDAYERLLSRLEGRLQLRGNAELFFVLSRPEAIYIQVGELCARRGRYQDALRHFRAAADREPNNFDYQSHVVRGLIAAGDHPAARKLAAELVSDHRASSDSLELLKKAYGPSATDEQVINELRRILKDRPNDRSIAFAIADLMVSAGRASEAHKLLSELLEQSSGDLLVVRRLFEFHLDQHQTTQAARLVIQTLARQPEALSEMEQLWSRLVRYSTRDRLRLATVKSLEVPADAQASKHFWTARTADGAARERIAVAALEKAAAIHPPFAPAYRELLAHTLFRRNIPDAQRLKNAAMLIERVSSAGRADLAAEMQGSLHLYSGKPSDAVKSFKEAIVAGARSPVVHVSLAQSLIADGKQAEAERVLWKVVQDWPTFELGYQALFLRYLRGGDHKQANQVLSSWLAADPFSTNARLIQAQWHHAQRRPDAAEATYTNLLREEPDNPLVLRDMRAFYASTGREEEFHRKLEEERARHPDNAPVVQALIDAYVAQKRIADATRALDDMRRAVASDAEQLYFLAHLYERLEHSDTSEQLLDEVLRLDPANVLASNDLSYFWAEKGKNLSRAETLARVAVEAEPENSAFLDSLGWVLYKRGKFEEARKHLDRATELSDPDDPVVLDHLGDVLYRLDRPTEAADLWKRTLERLGEVDADRDDLQKLLLQVKQKIRQQESGQLVDVAPSVEPPEASQAKKEPR